ncbi:MAG: polysaccharide biosynthesis protein [Lachnospiraceae bacterium]|nr:polysaccharide biosynthesis protein [Lachnospiraceae bacterium]
MSNKKNGSTNFILQGSILAIASIVSRIIGLIYRIPLISIVGDIGMSYYGCAFEIYNVLLLISSFSLPLAVSKLVSASLSNGSRRNAMKIFKGALAFAFVSGSIAALIVFFGATYITGDILKTPMAVYALRVLAPTLLIVAVLGAVRGFFQGLGTMMPSAFSQIIEQIFNAVVSVLAAYLLARYGTKYGEAFNDPTHYSAAFGAAGGTLGTGAGALAGLLFVLFVFMIYKPVFKRMYRKDTDSTEQTYKEILFVLAATIIPVLLSTTIYNISSILDQGIFKNVVIAQGYNTDLVDEYWGIFTGKYKTLINVPLSIASAMASSCVPSITRSFQSEDFEDTKRQILSATRFVMIIAFPCTVGMAVLASPILRLLFGDSSEVAANMLAAGAVSIIFYSLSTLSNGLLQGINRMKIPVRNAAIALVLHIVFLLALLYGFNLHIFAVIYANAFFALCMCVLNELSLKKYSGYQIEIKKTYLIPLFSSVVMGVVTFILYKTLDMLIGINFVCTVVSIVVAVIVYGLLMLLLKGLTEEEIVRFPKGRTIAGLLKRIHLLS